MLYYLLAIIRIGPSICSRITYPANEPNDQFIYPIRSTVCLLFPFFLRALSCYVQIFKREPARLECLYREYECRWMSEALLLIIV